MTTVRDDSEQGGGGGILSTMASEWLHVTASYELTARKSSRIVIMANISGDDQFSWASKMLTSFSSPCYFHLQLVPS